MALNLPLDFPGFHPTSLTKYRNCLIENEQERYAFDRFIAVPSLDWAARTALGYAPHAVVLAPEELRCLVSEQARAVAAQHASGK